MSRTDGLTDWWTDGQGGDYMLPRNFSGSIKNITKNINCMSPCAFFCYSCWRESHSEFLSITHKKHYTEVFIWLVVFISVFCMTDNLYSVIFFGLRFAFFTHISGEKTHSFKICELKKRNDFRQLNGVISEWRSAKQRRIYQISWITWPIRLWLLWGIV